MEGFDQKTLKVSRGFTYTYYTSSPSTHKTDPSLPSLFFCHGWPDDAYLWHSMATHLLTLPFKIIIPDLLGYAGSSKPSDPHAYKFDAMSKDLTEICAAESASKVIVVGHDWGSVVAARFYNYHPDHVVGMVLLNVVYLPPSKEKFDLDAVNEFTKQVFGYPIYEYWYFFTSASAPALLKSNVERLYAALHAAGPNAMKDLFTNPDVFPAYLSASPDSIPEPAVRAYAQSPAFKRHFVDRLGRDGFEGAQAYYTAFKDNIQHECDSQLPAERSVVNVPFLYIGCDQDAVCRPEMLQGAKDAGLIPDCEEAPLVHCAHWSPYEAPEEMAKPIIEWLGRKFLG
jgi:soluble epoxide hydrolase/lipid-phosphate phosphatase